MSKATDRNASSAHTSTLSLWRDRFVFTAPTFASERSCRPAIVVAMAAHGLLQVRTATRSYTGSALVIGPNVERGLIGDGGLYSLNLDPSSPLSHFLRNRRYFEKTEVIDLSSAFTSDLRAAVTNSIDSPQNCADSYSTSEMLLRALLPETKGLQPLDPRVDLVASWLWNNVPVRAEPEFLCSLCRLSESRLAHLFTAEMGISLKQYLLWVKMRKAAELFVRQVSLAAVAREIGFADAPHLSRTFTNYFSLTPSFLSNPALVRMQVCYGTSR